MSYDYHVVLGSLAMCIALASYVPYFRDMFRGTTKPHPFSWFIWGLITAIIFAAQTVEGGGMGTWVSGLTALACFSVSALALAWGDRKISAFDWFCFFSALFGIVLWRMTSSPLAAVIIATITDLIAYIPTFVKAYHRPREETLSTYVLSTLKWVFAIPALATFNLTTLLFPVAMIIANTAFVVMVCIRRRQLNHRIT